MKMNKKEREQLLRDTLDQCLSGLDNLPSDRAEVNRRLTENMPEAKRRIRFRRFAVPAVALALCVCLIVTGTHLGMIPWPDRIRPQEAKVTATPVALAQPAGEGTETPEPAGEGLVPILSLATDVPLDRIGDIDCQTASFFASWQQENLLGMRSRTGIQSENPDYTPAEETFRTLVNFYTPETMKIESISGTENDLVRTVTAVCRMKDSLFASFDLYRFRIDFTGREGERLLDFRSLHSFDQLDADGQAVVRSVTWPYLLARSMDPDLAESLVPLNLVSEKEGVRFEVISAAACTDRLLVVWSLQGPEGNNGSPFLASVPPDVRCGRLEQYRTNTSIHTYYDESAKVSLVTEEYHFSGIDLAAAGSIPLSLDPIPVLGTETIDLLPYYEQYSSRVQVVNTPVSLAVDTYMDPDTYFRELPRILDYTLPLDIPLTDHIRLGGIGDVDGHLHVQLHYVDNDVAYPSPNGGGTCLKSATRVDRDRLSSEPFRWCETGADFFADGWIEYVFHYVEERRSIPVTIITADKYIAGGWSVEVPISAIRAAEPAASETQAQTEIENRFGEFFSAWNTGDLNAMLEYCSPAWMSIQVNPKQSLFTILQNRTPSSFTVESVSGLPGDTVREITATVSMYYNDSRPEVPILMTVRLIREDNIWYVDPDSLVSYRKIPTPEPDFGTTLVPTPEPEAAPEPKPSPEPESETDLISLLQETSPDCLTDVVPVGLSCEQEGFRLELVSASVKETSALFIWSLQDLEGGRCSTNMYSPFIDFQGTSGAQSLEYTSISDLRYDASEQKYFFTTELSYGSPDSISDDEIITAVLPELELRKENRLSIGEFLREYAGQASFTDLPELLPKYSGIGVPEGEQPRMYGTDDYRSLGLKVLDYTHPLSVSLHEYLELSGIGVADGQLHVQLHYPDSWRSDPKGYLYRPIQFVNVIAPFEAIVGWTSPVPQMEWDTDGDGEADFTEFVFACDSADEDADNVLVDFYDFTGSVYGDWKIEIPIKAVWTGGSAAAEAEVPEDIETRIAEFFDAWKENRFTEMLDYCSPSWRSAQENPIQSLFTFLMNRTPSSCTVESVSGSPGEPERKVTTLVSMYYNDRKPEAQFRMTIRIVMKDNAWYIDPESLVSLSYRMITTPEPDIGTTLVHAPEPEAPEDIENRLAEFIYAWNTNRFTDMLELCSPGWVSAQEDPKQALFMILRNRTPSSYTVESVSGSPGDTVHEITATVSIYYNDRKPEVPIRIPFRMVQEDNHWYVDPESLITYRKITTPEPEAEPSPEPESDLPSGISET